jgi:hypothetical protein
VVGPTATLSDRRPIPPATPSASEPSGPPPSPPRGALSRHWLAWLLLAIGLCCLAAAVILTSIGWAAAPPLPLGVVPQAEAAPAGSTPDRPDSSPGAPASRAPATKAGASPATPPPAPAAPIHVALPALAIDAPVVPIGVQAGGGLAIPDDPKVVGWWQDGARPGDSGGTVVLAGHVDTARDGAGALFPLTHVLPGQHIVLTTSHGAHDYHISAMRSYLKADLPTDVFATTGQPRLILITCAGFFDSRTKQYADNLVVYALPGVRPINGVSG